MKGEKQVKKQMMALLLGLLMLASGCSCQWDAAQRKETAEVPVTDSPRATTVETAMATMPVTKAAGPPTSTPKATNVPASTAQATDETMPTAIPTEELPEVVGGRCAHRQLQYVVIKQRSSTEDGKAAYVCVACGTTVRELTLSATGQEPQCLEDKGHKYVETFIQQPDCETDGEMRYTCDVCHETVSVVLPALGHTPVKTERIEPTCQQEGKTEGIYCSTCGKIIEEAEPILKSDHVYMDGKCFWCGAEKPQNSTSSGDLELPPMNLNGH